MTPPRLTRFQYDGHWFTVAYDPDDASGIGAIRELVDRDAYGLARFRDLTGVLVDVGANIGIATVILAKLNPLARCIEAADAV